MPVTIVGRSSSHFTRVVRIFALELEVQHTFQPVFDIASLDAATYAGNPALKVPVLVDERGPLFGAENICRELTRRSGKEARVVLRGDVRERVVENAEELVLHVMATIVSLIMVKMAGDARPEPPKLSPSLEDSMRFLDAHWEAVLAALPGDRLLSFAEVGLFCALMHIPFRGVVAPGSWPRLEAFCDQFGERQSARSTGYRFDAA
jgi:glutathione S-transferase